MASLEIIDRRVRLLGYVGLPYTFQFKAQGGMEAYEWQVVSGMLPPGLAVLTNGQLAGTPIQLGTFPSILLQVTDSEGATATHEFEMMILPSSGTSGNEGILTPAPHGDV